MDITSMTAVALGKKIKAKEISVVEAVKASLDQIEKVEEKVHSFVTIDREGALARAEEVQKLIDDVAHEVAHQWFYAAASPSNSQLYIVLMRTRPVCSMPAYS